MVLMMTLIGVLALTALLPNLPRAQASSYSPAPPGIDGSAGRSAFSGTTINVPLSTFNRSDIVVLEAGSAGNYGDTPHVFSVSDSAGLSWYPRLSNYAGGSTFNIDEWYAKSPNILTFDNITVTFSGTITGLGSWGKVFGVSGANYTSPWAVTSAVVTSGTSNLPVALIATTGSNDMLIGNTIQRHGDPWTAGSGFTLLVGAHNYEAAEYGIAVNQGTQTVQFSSSNSTNQYLIMADAIQPTLKAPTAPLSLNAVAGSGRVNLTWSPPSSNGGAAISNYKIHKGTTSGVETWETMIGNLTTYTDGGLSTGVTYYYKISAVNGIGQGGMSNEASATPTTTKSPPFLPVGIIIVGLAIAVVRRGLMSSRPRRR